MAGAELEREVVGAAHLWSSPAIIAWKLIFKRGTYQSMFDSAKNNSFF
jgi:hypothetical protein